jgi:NADPH-dependent curcumin reductase CurA
MSAVNRQIRLAARPQGEVKPTDWEHADTPAAEPGEGEFAGRTRFVSLDPAMRGWLDDRPSYLPPVGLGEVMRAGTVVEVTASNHPTYRVGDHVVGTFGVQEHVVSDGRGTLRVDPAAAPLSTYLGALGMPGMTAYFGLLEVGALKVGETVVVSGAAGAVGTIVGQIAKVKGCRVVGIAGGPDKCKYVTDELGFDACIDYRQHPDVKSMSAALKEACPNGIDGYFENVGGYIFDAVLLRTNAFARIALCGMIAGYDGQPLPLANPALFLINRIKLEGFIVSEHMEVWPEALAELGGLVASGKLRPRESVAQGIEAAPEAFLGLLKGRNFGKQLVKLI